MSESLHKIISNYMNISDADDLCQDICCWLIRNYGRKPIINSICEDIWHSCIEADKSK